jgi:predicted Fe-Mo cluster-binding NifX family protein
MKIAIPVDEKTLESNVCVSFGRTPYFLIYDVETKEIVTHYRWEVMNQIARLLYMKMRVC